MIGFCAVALVIGSVAAFAKGKRTGRVDGTFSEPAIIDLRDFANAIIGLNPLVDGFESLPEGLVETNEFDLLNGTYIGTLPLISYFADPATQTLSNDVFGTNASGAVLTDNSLQNARTLTNFPEGTTYFGMDLLATDSAEFDIVVVGNSGIMIREAVRGGELSGFLGVHDPQGIISVSIATVDFSNSGGDGKGLSNFYMDNIITAGN
ncbi:MAG: hypothetical protein R3C05_16180 [Pirellulaceae bacterium]